MPDWPLGLEYSVSAWAVPAKGPLGAITMKPLAFSGTAEFHSRAAATLFGSIPVLV